MHDETELIIPDYDLYNTKPYPGHIRSGTYDKAKGKELLKKHKDNPEALQFLQDMLEEYDEFKLSCFIPLIAKLNPLFLPKKGEEA